MLVMQRYVKSVYDVTQSNEDASCILNNDINYNNAFFSWFTFFCSQITLKYHEFHFQSVSHHICIFIEHSLRSINAHQETKDSSEVFTHVSNRDLYEGVSSYREGDK